jgi:hypothetical protein
VRVRVIPVQAGRVVEREVELVVEALTDSDVHEDVVRIALRRDVEPVGMEVGPLTEAVDQPERDADRPDRP